MPSRKAAQAEPETKLADAADQAAADVAPEAPIEKITRVAEFIRLHDTVTEGAFDNLVADLTTNEGMEIAQDGPWWTASLEGQIHYGATERLAVENWAANAPRAAVAEALSEADAEDAEDVEAVSA